jgi:hypothetical protein
MRWRVGWFGNAIRSIKEISYLVFSFQLFTLTDNIFDCNVLPCLNAEHDQWQKTLIKTELWNWSTISSVSVTEHREVHFTSQLQIKVGSHQTYILFSRKAWPCMRHRTYCSIEFEGLIINNPLTSYHSVVFNLISRF